MAWYEVLFIFACGFFLGALVMSLCAMSRCNDCGLAVWKDKG